MYNARSCTEAPNLALMRCPSSDFESEPELLGQLLYLPQPSPKLFSTISHAKMGVGLKRRVIIGLWASEADPVSS